MSDHDNQSTDKPFQDLNEPVETEQVYVDLDPNDPELLKLRREAGDPSVPEEVTPDA